MEFNPHTVKKLKAYIDSMILNDKYSLEEIKSDLIKNENEENHPIIEFLINEKIEKRKLAKAFDKINGFSSSQNSAWLDESLLNGNCWESYKNYLKNKDFSSSAIQNIDLYTKAIITNCSNPNENLVDSKGLVVGYVQSGKTANFIGLLARAVDVGYKLIIVLTGTKEKLRRQTQKRIKKDLCSYNHKYIAVKTGDKKDFTPPSDAPQNWFSSNQTSLLVVKKNQQILQNFINWILYADTSTNTNRIETPLNEREKCATLIIDDEADEASINVSRTDDRSRIYERIIRITEVLPRSSFVGYTATPFANVLIDHNSFEGKNLYPKNFIIALSKPDGYFGSEEFFGRRRTPLELFEDPELEDIEPKNLHNIIPPFEVPYLKPSRNSEVNQFQPKVNKTLRRAIVYYILSSSAKICRLGKKEHTSMFVHTHVRINMQEKTLIKIDQNLKRIKSKFKYSKNFLTYCELLWKEESSKVERKEDEIQIEFNDIKQNLDYVLDNLTLSMANTSRLTGQIQLKPENPELEDPDITYITPLDYEKKSDDENGKIYLVVGGNILSRGLTLEGLTVSYFLRTTSMYDTLLQMGRWFGFRNGYSDLPRIWTTQGLFRNFYELSRVEETIREDIKKYQIANLDPINFKVRIPLIPGLEVTSRLKRKDAVENRMWRLSKDRPELRRFSKKKEWLNHNINSVRELIQKNINKIYLNKLNNNLIIKDISNNDILNFFDTKKNQNAFKLRTEETQIKELDVLNLIKAYEEKDKLSKWNIVLLNKKEYSDKLGSIPLINNIELNCFNRAPLNKEIDYIQFKTISSEVDQIKDIESELHNKFKDKSIFDLFDNYILENQLVGLSLKDKELKDCDGDYFRIFRKIITPKTGLIVFYPISKYSKANNKPNSIRSSYQDLDSEEHIISFMILFPPLELKEERYIDIGNYISGVPESYDDDEYGENDDYDDDIDELGDLEEDEQIL